MAEKINIKDDMTLEEAMERLEGVVAQLSKENIRLEDSLSLYEEGVKLVALCNSKLEAAKNRVNVIKITEDGELVGEPFESAE